jgi:uncharacterized RDD family membrane protein YckC
MTDPQSTGRFAGVWRRVAAFALDYILILFYLALLTLIMLALDSFFGITQWLFAERIRAQVSAFLLVTLPVTLYFSFGEASARKATRGKAKLRIQVTDLHGRRIGLWRALARTGLKFVPWELSHTLIWTITFSNANVPDWVNYGFVLVYGLLGLNLASLVLTRKHQALYDLLAGTCVIKQS